MLIIPPKGLAAFYGYDGAGNPAITGISRTIPMNTVVYDNAGLLYLGAGTTELKIKTAGLYYFSATTSFESSTAGGNCIFSLNHITSGVSARAYCTNTGAGSASALKVDLLYYCNVNDLINVAAANSSASGRLLQAAVGAITSLTAIQLS